MLLVLANCSCVKIKLLGDKIVENRKNKMHGVAGLHWIPLRAFWYVRAGSIRLATAWCAVATGILVGVITGAD